MEASSAAVAVVPQHQYNVAPASRATHIQHGIAANADQRAGSLAPDVHVALLCGQDSECERGDGFAARMHTPEFRSSRRTGDGCRLGVVGVDGRDRGVGEARHQLRRRDVGCLCRSDAELRAGASIRCNSMQSMQSRLSSDVVRCIGPNVLDRIGSCPMQRRRSSHGSRRAPARGRGLPPRRARSTAPAPAPTSARWHSRTSALSLSLSRVLVWRGIVRTTRAEQRRASPTRTRARCW